MAEILRTGIDAVHRKIVYPYLTRGRNRNEAHRETIKRMEQFQQNDVLMKVFGEVFTFEDSILATTFAGVNLRGPVGLAAGFDKNAAVNRFLGEGLGIPYIKDGSICLIKYGGNTEPTIFPLPLDHGLINRMGFPGEGSNNAEKRLKNEIQRERDYRIIVNIAASRPSFEQGKQIEHYAAVAKQLRPYGDWHEVNVSSPNTEGVRALQEPDVFKDLASALEEVYRDSGVAVVYKFGPDLEKEILLQDLRIAKDHGAAGATVTNTSTDPEIRRSLKSPYKDEQGGASGAPLTQKALEVSHIAHDFIGGEMDINRAGGIMNGKDLWDALTYGGATIADVYTAFVDFEISTPNLFYYFLRDLSKAMRADRMTSMADFKDLRGKNVPFPKI